MPTYRVEYKKTVSYTKTTTQVQYGEAAIDAPSFLEAVELAKQFQNIDELEPDTCPFMTTSSSETPYTVVSIEEASPLRDVPLPVSESDSGLPAAEYDPEPAPDGGDYNFIQVEPTPRAGADQYT